MDREPPLLIRPSLGDWSQFVSARLAALEAKLEAERATIDPFTDDPVEVGQEAEASMVFPGMSAEAMHAIAGSLDGFAGQKTWIRNLRDGGGDPVSLLKFQGSTRAVAGLFRSWADITDMELGLHDVDDPWSAEDLALLGAPAQVDDGGRSLPSTDVGFGL